jgi:hypothetical protein
MNEKLRARLKAGEAAFPALFASAASPAEVQRAEASLQAVFSTEYKEFLDMYGGAMPGAWPVFGTRPVDVMGQRLNTVEAVTRHFRKQGWPHTEDAAVISENHAGDPVILKNDGTVFVGSHDGFGEQTWRDFDEFLDWLLNGA